MLQDALAHQSGRCPHGTVMVKALSLTLQPDPAAAAEARLAARRAFGDKLAPDRLRELQLVLSELVTNAIRHGQGEVTVRLQLDGDHVRGEVIDRGAGFEHEVRERGPGEVGGHGLRFVEALVDRWGIHEGTTHVWFELSTPGASPQPSGPRLGEDQRPDALD